MDRILVAICLILCLDAAIEIYRDVTADFSAKEVRVKKIETCKNYTYCRSGRHV